MISAIILAAGTSSRMGETKQLLPFKGTSLIRTVTSNVLASSVDEVLVVSGCKAEAIKAQVDDLPVKIVYNPDYKLGQGTTLAAGAGQVNPAAEIFLVFMADQPLIDAAIIDSLIAAYQQRSCLALRPVYHGQPGHPVIFDGSLLEAMKALSNDEGARQILAGLGKKAVELPVPYPEVVFDVDTPEAYQKLTRL